MRGIKPKICPKCGSGEIVPIVYGYPLESLMEEAKQGKVDEALGQFQEALRIRPGLAPTLRNLELLRKKSGRPQEHR